MELEQLNIKLDEEDIEEFLFFEEFYKEIVFGEETLRIRLILE